MIWAKRSRLGLKRFDGNGTHDPGRITGVILVWTEVKKAGRCYRNAFFLRLPGRTKCLLPPVKRKKKPFASGERPASL